jgi:8-oxo-dGTP diphosphatase
MPAKKKVTETQYTLGLVFFSLGTTEHILLLKKKKPPSQAGKWNGVGGRFEANENKFQCLVRETKEEANLETTQEDWTFIGTFYKPGKWIVHVAYTHLDTLQLRSIPSFCEEGEFRLFQVTNLPETVMPNIRWLIPLIERRDTERQEKFEITYMKDNEE